MTDAQSFIFDFTRVPNFFDNWNIQFRLSDMNTQANFQLVFASDCPNNIQECLTTGGALDSTKVLYDDELDVVDCKLKWENETISLRSDATWNISGSEHTLKAVFLRVKDTNNNGYVMGYSINGDAFIVTNKIIFDGGIKFWSIYNE